MKNNWLKPKYAKDLEALARGEKLSWQDKQRPAVVMSKADLRKQAANAMQTFGGQVTKLPTAPPPEPTGRRR